MNENLRELKKLINQINSVSFNADQFIRDLFFMVQFLTEQGFTCEKIMASVCHDLGGYVRDDRCFVPHSKGYEELAIKCADGERRCGLRKGENK